MQKSIVLLATLDTKGEEAQFVKQRIEALGDKVVVVDLGVVGEPAFVADVSRDEVARAGGSSMDALRRSGTREAATPVLAEGAIAILRRALDAGQLDGVLGFGGLQGTALCTQIMRALPYGLPKVMVSTVASGDTSSYVDIKDITMMFSVGDILGLNPLTRRILANAAGAVYGMARIEVDAAIVPDPDKPVIGMSNLGVLTEGAKRAIARFASRGYEVIVFHAVGSGGRAMEQLMREGMIGAVFDYALGEIADEVFGALRAGGPDRLTVAGPLGLPQVIVPGGAEHLGVLVPANTVPERWSDHDYVFHSPVVFVPRLRGDELERVAAEITRRLAGTRGKATFMIPLGGTGRYGSAGGALRDEASDARFFAALRRLMPATIEVVEHEGGAEDPAFVDAAVDRLLAWIEGSV